MEDLQFVMKGLKHNARFETILKNVSHYEESLANITFIEKVATEFLFITCIEGFSILS